MKTIFIIILIILFLAALWFLLSYLCWRIAFRRGHGMDIAKTTKEDSPYYQYLPEIKASREYVSGLSYESVNIISKDDLHLAGRLYEVPEPRALLLLFHGYRAKAENDFACAFSYFLEHGYSLLLVDERAHGLSEGKSLTFGIMERWDCLFWANWAAERFPDLPLILDGMSMGSATVLMAADLPFPKNIRGIIADCGYTSPKAIIKKVIRDMHIPPALAYPFVRTGAKLFGKFSLEEYSAPQALKRCNLPVLLIHGEGDTFVPCQMSQENYDACSGKKTLITVPEAEHGLSFLVDRETVLSALTIFLDSILEKKEEP